MFDSKTDHGPYIHLKYTLYYWRKYYYCPKNNSDSNIAPYKVIALNLLNALFFLQYFRFFPLFPFVKAISFPLLKAIAF